LQSKCNVFIGYIPLTVGLRSVRLHLEYVGLLIVVKQPQLENNCERSNVKRETRIDHNYTTNSSLDLPIRFQ